MSSVKIFELLPQAYALHQSGKLREAEVIYRKALAKPTKDAIALYMFGLLHIQLGNWKDAVRWTSVSLSVNPAQPEAENNLGLALQNLGQNEKALSHYDRAIKLNPSYAGAWYNHGNALQDLERHEEALVSYRQALALRPNHANTWTNLGKAYKVLERYNEACDCYRRAISLAPDNAAVYNNLGNALNELEHRDEALASLNQAISLEPGSADAHFNLGLVLDSMDRTEDAMAAFDKAIELKPDNPRALGFKGSLLIQSGRMDEAKTFLHRSLELGNSEFGPLAALLSLKRDYTDDDPYFRRLETLYASRSSLSINEQSRFCFAMGKALEGLGRYDEAYAAYDEGNRLYRSLHPFDESEDERYLAEASSFFSSDLFEKYSALAAQLPTDTGHRVPIFIVGMPRSGTTLIEQVLASHPALHGAGELETMGKLFKKVELPAHNAPNWEKYLLQLRALGREYLDSVWKLAPDARYITDKMPHNFKFLGLIHMMLPNARIIHARRSPMDVCFSCFALRFKQGHGYCYEQGSLGRHYLFYHRLMQHWHDVLPEGRVLDVRYEDMVADLEGQARRILDYLGMPWDPACLNFYENKRTVKTASVTQVRKPIYSSSVARWKRFEKHLTPLAEIVSAVKY